MIRTHEALRKQWKSRISDYMQSQLTVNDWCKKEGVTVRQLRYWLDIFKDKTEVEDTVSWTPLIATPEHDASEGITVHIGSARIEVRHGFDADLLSRVLKVVASC